MLYLSETPRLVSILEQWLLPLFFNHEGMGFGAFRILRPGAQGLVCAAGLLQKERGIL